MSRQHTARRSRAATRLLLPAVVVVLAALTAPFVPVQISPGYAAPSASPEQVFVVPGRQGQASGLTLPQVAAQALGDGSRWLEIFSLNRDRRQPDGGALTTPDTPLRGGWVLVLPPTPGRQPGTGQLPEGSAQPGSTSGAVAPSGRSAGASGRSTGASGRRIAGLPAWLFIAGGAGVLLGGLAAAGVMLAVRRGRRPGDRHPARAGGHGDVRRLLDQALGHLPEAVRPQVYAAVVGPDRISLRMSPAVPEASPPWQAREQGWVWEALNWQLSGVPAPVTGTGARPGGEGALPLLLPVGTIGGEWTAVNLGRAPGLVALTGDARAATSAAATVLDEIGADPAAAGIGITVIGPVPRGRVGSDRIRVAGSVAEVVGPAAEHLADPDATGTLPSGVLPAAASPTGGYRGLARQLVVVTAPLSAAEQEQLAAAAAASDGTAAVVVVGDVPTAAWRFEAEAGGALDIGVLGLELDGRGTARARTA